MARWKLKGCPRCKGDLLVEKNDNKWEEYCLQCGYRRGLKTVIAEPSKDTEESERIRESHQKDGRAIASTLKIEYLGTVFEGNGLLHHIFFDEKSGQEIVAPNYNSAKEQRDLLRQENCL